MKAHVWVMFKSTVLDPQGQRFSALASLGYSKIQDVRQGKFFVLQSIGSSRDRPKMRSSASRKTSSQTPLLKNFASKSSIRFPGPQLPAAEANYKRAPPVASRY